MKPQMPSMFFEHVLTELMCSRKAFDRLAEAQERTAAALERIATVEEERIRLETTVGARRSVIPHGVKVDS